METLIAELKESGRIPTREDIARLLASVGAPGEKRDEKKAAVRELFSQIGRSSNNFQGHDIELGLDSYGEY